MTYTLTVNADNPKELANLLSALTGNTAPVQSAKTEKGKNTAASAEAEETGKEEKVTKEMVRELTAEKVQAGKSAKVKEVLKKYNAKNAATVPDESLVDFHNDLKAI